MTINITHCGEVMNTRRTADETGLAVGDYFQLVGGGPLFVAVEINWAWKHSPTVTGHTLRGDRVTKARTCDVFRIPRFSEQAS